MGLRGRGTVLASGDGEGGVVGERGAVGTWALD